MYFVEIDKPINQGTCLHLMSSFGLQLWHRENNIVNALILLINKHIFDISENRS